MSRHEDDYQHALEEMQRQSTVFNEYMDIDIKVTVRKYGPTEPYKPGSIVVPSVKRIVAYTTLDPDYDVIRGTPFEPPAMGTVIESRWHVMKNSIKQASIDPVLRTNMPSEGVVILRDAYAELYYRVMTSFGILWMRWDWVCCVAKAEGTER